MLNTHFSTKTNWESMASQSFRSEEYSVCSVFCVLSLRCLSALFLLPTTGTKKKPPVQLDPVTLKPRSQLRSLLWVLGARGKPNQSGLERLAGRAHTLACQTIALAPQGELSLRAGISNPQGGEARLTSYSLTTAMQTVKAHDLSIPQVRKLMLRSYHLLAYL